MPEVLISGLWAGYCRLMTSGGGENGGFKGLLGGIAKAIGGAFVEGLERQMQEHLTTELSAPNLASRNQTVVRLRMVLARPEFVLEEQTSELIARQLKAVLASADATVLVRTLSRAVRTSGWKAMQRLMFYQLVAPHPNVNVSLGAGAVGTPEAGGDGLPPEPPPADRPDYLRLVSDEPEGTTAEAPAEDAPQAGGDDGDDGV